MKERVAVAICTVLSLSIEEKSVRILFQISTHNFGFFWVDISFPGDGLTLEVHI